MNPINQVLLLGNLARDADVKTMRDGETKLANFTVATSRRYKDRGGDWKESADYHRCVLWYPDDEQLKKLRKGAAVLVQGRLQTRSWDDSKGEKRYATEVICTGRDLTLVREAKPASERDRAPVSRRSTPAPGDDIPF